MPDLQPILMGYLGAIVVLWMIVPLFPLLYVIIRWRAAGKGEPGLGLYSGLLYFRAVAVLLCVTGLSLLLHSFVAEHSDSRAMEEMRRVGAGVLVGGLVVWGLQLAVLGNVEFGPSSEPAKRVFHGFIMVVAGLVSVATIVVVCVILFQKSSDFDDIREILAWAAVWTVTYLLHVGLLRRGVVAI